ncbi:MAG: hypothetical protein MN733_18240 [Nitrososphaera sp.]|nr:hypothetical protein [Nitrososphaera sp.]
MAKASKPTKVVSVTLTWLEKVKRALTQGGVEAGTGGIAAAIPLTVGDEPQPTRVGSSNSDKTTPFVETRLDTLYGYYHGYRTGKAFQEWLPYCDTLLLNNGGDGFESGRDVRGLTVSVRREGYSLPVSLRRHGEVATQLFKELGKIRKVPGTEDYENDITARIISWSAESNRIDVQKASYFDQVATNLTMDWASGFVSNERLSRIATSRIATVRNSFERPREGKLPSLGESSLANTLGVAAFLYTADRQILIPIRGDNQAIMSQGEGKFHCSASGVFKWENLENSGDEASFQALAAGMHDEISRELNVPKEAYQLTPLAFTRELARGGKPQLFFSAKCELELKHVRERMKDAEEKWEFLNEEDLPLHSPLHKWLNQRESVIADKSTIETCFTYEGWMGFSLLRAYLAGKAIL